MPRKHNSVPKRIFKKILKLVLIVGIPIFVFSYVFSLQEINVKGSTRNTEEVIKDYLIQSKLDSNTLILYTKKKYLQEVEIPFVEKMDIKLGGFNSIDIRIYEKIVTGCVKFMGDYLYFDKDGVVVESSSERLEDIPLIKGLDFDKIILHDKLEVQNDDLFDVILNLTQLIQLYDLKVDNISFNFRNEVTLDCDNVKVFLGKKKSYDQPLGELKNILLEAGDLLSELDLSNFEKGYIYGKSGEN